MLINATLYKNGNKLEDLNFQSLTQRELNDTEIIWADFKEPNKEDLNLLLNKFDLHELTIEDITHGEQIPKIEEYDDNLFIVIKQLQYKYDDNEIQFGDVYIIANKSYLISVRTGYGKDFQFVKKIIEKNKQLNKGVGFVLYSVMDTIVDRYFPIINTLQKEFESFENMIFDDKHSNKVELMKSLYNFKSKVREIENNINPLLDAYHKLFGGRVPEICEDMDNYYRDTHDHLIRISNALNSLLDSVNSSIQIAMALISIEESSVTKKLASWASIFAVITCFAGIWGMNFEKMPETKLEHGYIMAILIMIIVAILLRMKFKKSGWL